MQHQTCLQNAYCAHERFSFLHSYNNCADGVLVLGFLTHRKETDLPKGLCLYPESQWRVMLRFFFVTKYELLTTTCSFLLFVTAFRWNLNFTYYLYTISLHFFWAFGSFHTLKLSLYPGGLLTWENMAVLRKKWNKPTAMTPLLESS